MANRTDPTNKNRTDTDAAGFTLVEVLVAMVIFVTGFVAVAMMQTMAIRGNGLGRYLTERSAVAQAQMESLIGLPFTHTNLQAGTYAATVNMGGNSFGSVWVVENNQPVAGQMRIRITVTDPAGRRSSMVRIKDQYVY